MKITVLGSGAWEGIPAPFCHCLICEQATKNSFDKNNRMRPCFMVETEKGSLLLEASPDLRIQSTRFNLPTIKHYIISHNHFDHMYGLKELHTWIKYSLQESPKVYVSPKTKESLDKEFGYLPLNKKELQPFESFNLFGITITALPVYHVRAQDESLSESAITNAYGFLLEANNKKFAYLGDYYKVPQESFKMIENIDILIADGTYLLTDAYRDIKPNHMHGNDILLFTKSTNAKKVYFHSISHLTHQSHEQLQRQLPDRHFLTYDGMEIFL